MGWLNGHYIQAYIAGDTWDNGKIVGHHGPGIEIGHEEDSFYDINLKSWQEVAEFIAMVEAAAVEAFGPPVRSPGIVERQCIVEASGPK